jgi:SAM-dependent methyltransferase
VPPNKEKMRAEWKGIARAWIEHIRGKGDPSREGFLDDWMLREVGDVRGLDVIDLGCGEGRFARMLAQRGTRVTGVDSSKIMIDAAAAAEPHPSASRYRVGDMEALRDIDYASFELAIAYLPLVDMLDVRAALAEAFRVLRPGGRFIACNLAPMVTAGNCWVKAGNRKLHFLLDNYFDESPRNMPMCGGNVSNLHRMLSTCLNTFIAAGFTLEAVREPFPSPEQLQRRPENEDNLRVPLFVIYVLRKAR